MDYRLRIITFWPYIYKKVYFYSYISLSILLLIETILIYFYKIDQKYINTVNQIYHPKIWFYILAQYMIHIYIYVDLYFIRSKYAINDNNNYDNNDYDDYYNNKHEEYINALHIMLSYGLQTTFWFSTSSSDKALYIQYAHNLWLLCVFELIYITIKISVGFIFMVVLDWLVKNADENIGENMDENNDEDMDEDMNEIIHQITNQNIEQLT